jgi:hypothetical protein
MTLHPSDVVRRALTDAEMTRITTAVAAADSTANAVAATVTGTLTALLAPSGETLDSYSPERPVNPSRFAIPTAQWHAICEACLARADAFGGRVQAGIALIDLMPGSYDDPSVTVTTPPPPDQRPYEYVLTVTREATDVIAAASARCAELARCYGGGSREYLNAIQSWHAQLPKLFSMAFGASARISRDDELSLLVTTSTRFTYGIIFHPDRRRCTVPGCTALIADDGTARASGPACPEEHHTPSFPLDAPEPGTWSFHS